MRKVIDWRIKEKMRIRKIIDDRISAGLGEDGKKNKYINVRSK